MTACVFKFVDFVHHGDDVRRFLPAVALDGRPQAVRAPLEAAWSIGLDGRLRRAWRAAGRSPSH